MDLPIHNPCITHLYLFICLYFSEHRKCSTRPLINYLSIYRSSMSLNITKWMKTSDAATLRQLLFSLFLSVCLRLPKSSRCSVWDCDCSLVTEPPVQIVFENERTPGAALEAVEWQSGVVGARWWGWVLGAGGVVWGFPRACVLLKNAAVFDWMYCRPEFPLFCSVFLFLPVIALCVLLSFYIYKYSFQTFSKCLLHTLFDKLNHWNQWACDKQLSSEVQRATFLNTNTSGCLWLMGFLVLVYFSDGTTTTSGFKSLKSGEIKNCFSNGCDFDFAYVAVEFG